VSPEPRRVRYPSAMQRAPSPAGASPAPAAHPAPAGALAHPTAPGGRRGTPLRAAAALGALLVGLGCGPEPARRPGGGSSRAAAHGMEDRQQRRTRPEDRDMQLEDITSRLSAHEPKLLDLEGHRHAAVAMILRRNRGDLEVLFIERTRNDADPWSGQMAFPGGVVEPADGGARQAAERETLEEVGIDLTAAAFMGRLDDMQGRNRAHTSGIVVAGFVYFDANGQRATRNYEVADIVWEPLATFRDPARFTRVEHPQARDEHFPGIRVGHSAHQVVWGLTRRFLISFFEIVGVPFLVDTARSQSISIQESD